MGPLQSRAEKLLKEVITAADAPATLRLCLHDAGTYDVATKKGGFDGSVVIRWEVAARCGCGAGGGRALWVEWGTSACVCVGGG